jgi:mono/diheme cytochrome c family protein
MIQPVLRTIATMLVLAATAMLLAGCGGEQLVKPKAIGFEPRIVGCSLPSECTSANRTMLRESREARKHRCPADKPDLLMKANGVLVCVATLPSAGPPAIGLSVPSAVSAHGPPAVADFKAGEVVAAQSGCEACHRIADAGNNGPGSDLTHIGSRLSAPAIERALVDSPAPMPSFQNLPATDRRALVYFLAQLR